MNLCNIKRTFELMPIRKWDTLYVLIDVHGVIIPGSWHRKNDFQFISPDCEEVLQWFSKRKDFRIILWTSSYKTEVYELLLWLERKGIHVDYLNDNPEVENTDYADFTDKPYFNILIDDKASFSPEYDWLMLGRELEICSGDKIFDWTPDKRQRLEEGINKTKQDLDRLIIF